MTRRFIFVTLAALVFASLPLQTSAKVIWIHFKNASTNCAWITAYKDTFMGWDHSPSPARFVAPGAHYSFNINAGDRGKIRAEIMAGAACTGHAVGANREYITNVDSDFLKLIGSSQANFQIVRGQ
jgi:hypothetical protein